MIDEIRVLNDSEPLPFMLEDETDVAENTRFKYRYLDLRRPALQKSSYSGTGWLRPRGAILMKRGS